MISYEFFDHQKLVLIRFDGEISEHDLVELIPFMLQKAKKSSMKMVINDLRNAILNFDLKSMEKIIEVRYSGAKYYSGFKVIFLIDTILQTTYSVLLSEKLKPVESNIIICSTLEYAIKSLGLHIDKPELENKLENLRFKFKPV